MSSSKRNRNNEIELRWTNHSATGSMVKNQPLFSYFKKSDENNTVTLLNKVSGVANPGELLAIMGPSGAGKTTLLNIISGRQYTNVNYVGDVTIYGNRVNSKQLNEIVAYIPQFQPFIGMIGCLTVKEHLKFLCELKLDPGLSEDEKTKFLDGILQKTHLKKCEDLFINNKQKNQRISGGELKRLSIASEIISDNPVLICDEPTTGLDHFMATEVIAALHSIAKEGRTVICTIHQPTSKMFYSFDRINFMSEGKVAFQGTQNDALTFFSSLGYVCPSEVNPADYILSVLSSSRQNMNTCSEKITNLEEIMSSLPILVPFWKQIFCMMSRAFIIAKRRNVSQSHMRQMAVTLVMAISTGRQMYMTSTRAMDLSGSISMFISFLPNSWMVIEAEGLLEEIPIANRECHRRLYGAWSYIISRFLLETIISFINVFLQCIIFYWIAGCYENGITFIIFFLYTWISTRGSALLGGVLVGLINSPQYTRSVISPIGVTKFVFAGYMINLSSPNLFTKVLKYVSIDFYTAEAIFANQWKNYENIDCQGVSSAFCFHNGTDILRHYGFSEENLYVNLTKTISICLVLFLISSNILALRIKFLKLQ